MQGFLKSLKLIIIGIILIGLLAMSYFHVANVKQEHKGDEVVTETTVVQEILLRDLEKSYPPSPKEVVRYYSDITQAFYNEKYSEQELEELAKKSLMLMDQELLAKNPYEDYLEELKLEIDDRKEKDCKIYSYNTSASTDVEYYVQDGRQMASLYCTYTIRLGTSMGNTTELFILRKDEANHWKILGWLVEEE